jgi:endonuclease III
VRVEPGTEVSVERLVTRWGAVDRRTMASVEDRLRMLLRL